MDDDELVAIALLLEPNKKKRNRFYRIHTLKQRLTESQFYLKRAKLGPKVFFRYYRMSKKCFDELHNGIREEI